MNDASSIIRVERFRRVLQNFSPEAMEFTQQVPRNELLDKLLWSYSR